MADRCTNCSSRLGRGAQTVLPGTGRPLLCPRCERSEQQPVIESSAVISECGRYRYLLRRRWGKGDSVRVFLMLNPSTADAEDDDATIRRCVAFARAWGHDAIEVVNLFGYRSKKPRKLSSVADPIGAGNDTHVLAAAKRSKHPVVCAWGAHSFIYKMITGRAEDLLALLRDAGAVLVCFGKTGNGQPLHPLRLSRDRCLEPLVYGDGAPGPLQQKASN